ncbi:MAG: class I SAM-dependent methyltransferase [Methanomassiliicoccales archaeon]|nr:MAG: class I SAM-dependent methyltransferase [Methanomassiliicoccales archaeon]
MKEDLYDNYMTTHFGGVHREIGQEYGIYHTYFSKNYLRHMPKNRKSRILDIGCGMGHFLYFLEKEGYGNYLGIDISGENIDFCKKQNFNVKLCDVFEYLKGNNKPFDVIVMNDIIEHFNKKEIIELLKLARTNLVKNGRLIVKVVNSSNPILGPNSRYIDFTHEIGFTEESLMQVLKISGFMECAVYPQDIYIYYHNPLNFVGMILSKLFNAVFRLLFILYGRKTTRIFTKSMIAVAIRK